MKYVTYEEKGNYGIITLSRENALNALNSEMILELDMLLDSISLNKVRCLILTGKGGRAFAAGADILEMKDFTYEEAKKFSNLGNRVFRKIETFSIPVIGAVNGVALGGGCELAMSCDIRICSENAVFGQPEVGLGITPGFGGTQRLARLVGPSMTKQIIYTGQNIKSDEAYRIGLVNQIYPPEDLLYEAVKMAERISLNAPIAVRNSKKAINEGLETDMERAVEIEAELFGSCFESHDQIEGMKAFVEKRKDKQFLNK